MQCVSEEKLEKCLALSSTPKSVPVLDSLFALDSNTTLLNIYTH